MTVKSFQNNSVKEYVLLEQKLLKNKKVQQYWKQLLANHSPFYPKKKKTHRGKTASQSVPLYELDVKLMKKLEKLRQTCHVSLKAVFLTAYETVLSEYFSQRSIPLGVVTNGRVEDLSHPFDAQGLFWNMSPFLCNSIQLGQEKIIAVQTLLNELDSLYGRYPLPSLLQDQPQPLFFASFNFVHFHHAKKLVKTLDFKVYDVFHLPLSLVVMKHNQKGHFSFSYDATFFDENDIQALGENFKTQLTQLCE